MGGKYELKEVATINVEFQQVVVFAVIDLYARRYPIAVHLSLHEFLAEEDVCKVYKTAHLW